MAQRNKGFVTGKERYTTMLDKALCHKVCKTSNVWTRRKCSTCDERTPSWLFRFHKHASEEQQIVRYESSSSDDSVGEVSVHYRIAAERDRRQKEMETKRWQSWEQSS